MKLRLDHEGRFENRLKISDFILDKTKFGANLGLNLKFRQQIIWERFGIRPTV